MAEPIRRVGGFTTAMGALAAGLAAAGAWTVATRRARGHTSRLHRVMVDLLLNALTTGDPATARHSRRVAALADALAAQLRLTRERHATLRVAALLHDMGKIEDEIFPIVHSTQPLSEEERKLVNEHPSTSAGILKPLERFHPGLTRIVRAHHECWNGRGYPDGLSGEEIPLEARVISAADVFDALTQTRSYREPMPAEDALRSIREGAGQRFDPGIVALLEVEQVRRGWLRIARRGRREEAEEEAEAGGAHARATRAGE
jgi:putative nucleotidyltransferase with HDIG domain